MRLFVAGTTPGHLKQFALPLGSHSSRIGAAADERIERIVAKTCPVSEDERVFVRHWRSVVDDRDALLNALMGLPPVVVGLLVYLLLSRAGPLGPMGLLFTPTAMIIAQSIIVLPIIAALSRQTIADLHEEYDEHLRSLGCSPLQSVATLLWDGRFRLLTAIMAGFGRAIAEVGAVIIVGGNIQHATRVMTTTIALETSKGNLALALGLGLILVTLALGVNATALVISDAARRRYG
jgi:tungstate transport system permease protein